MIAVMIDVQIDRQWGGFYFSKGKTIRVCLGFIAITIVPSVCVEMLDRENFNLRSALNQIVDTCDLCEHTGELEICPPYYEAEITGPGDIIDTIYEPCPQCSIARTALGIGIEEATYE